MNLKNFAAKVSQSFLSAKSAMQISQFINKGALKELRLLRKSPQKYTYFFYLQIFWTKKIIRGWQNATREQYGKNFYRSCRLGLPLRHIFGLERFPLASQVKVCGKTYTSLSIFDGKIHQLSVNLE